MKENVILTDILLVHIIDFATFNNTKQYEIVNTFTKFAEKAIELIFSKSHFKQNEAILGFIATGEGFFLILSPNLKGYGVILAMSLKNLTTTITKKLRYFKGIEIAVHSGEVMPFSDILDSQNFIGDGLNNCARYLEYKNDEAMEYFKDGYVIISLEASKEFMKFLEKNKKIQELLESLGFNVSKEIFFQDKHKFKHYGYYIWTNKRQVIIL